MIYTHCRSVKYLSLLFDKNPKQTQRWKNMA